MKPGRPLKPTDLTKTPKKISNLLRHHMKETGFTQKELANELDITPETLSNIIHGSNITIKTIDKILDYLGVQAWFLKANASIKGEPLGYTRFQEGRYYLTSEIVNREALYVYYDIVKCVELKDGNITFEGKKGVSVSTVENNVEPNSGFQERPIKSEHADYYDRIISAYNLVDSSVIDIVRDINENVGIVKAVSNEC